MSTSPSLASLIYRAKSTLNNSLGVSNPATNAIAAAIAGVSYGQYAYQDYLFKQLNPETADEEWLYLWANRFNVERLSSEYAVGTVNFNLTEGVIYVPSGVIIKTSSGTEYQVTTATLTSSAVPVQAVEAGEGGNLPADTDLYLVTAVTGLNPESITSNTIAGGSGLEEVEHWRARIVLAYNIKNAVGRLDDYQLWAKSSHSDIDLSWAADNTPALGQVTVYIAQCTDAPLLSDQIKDIAQEYIDANRLAGCHVFVVHPTLVSVPVIIADVDDIDTRNYIDIALQSFFTARLGSSEPLRANEVSTAISAITTEFTLVSPIATTEFANNELLTYGGATWQ